MKYAFLVMVLLPGAAPGQDRAQTARPGDFVPMPGVEYFCTNGEGQRVELGETICITAGCATWMARCDMSLNNPTWRKIQDGCIAVSAQDRLQALKPVL